MSEKETKPGIVESPPSELAVFLSRQSHRLNIPKLRREVQLSALSIGDISDIEQRYGSTFSELFPARTILPVERFLFMLYLSVRKEGKTIDQLKIGDYACTFEEVKEWFRAGDIKYMPEIIDHLLELSGFEPKKVSVAVPDAGQGQTGAN